MSTSRDISTFCVQIPGYSLKNEKEESDIKKEQIVIPEKTYQIENEDFYFEVTPRKNAEENQSEKKEENKATEKNVQPASDEKDNAADSVQKSEEDLTEKNVIEPDLEEELLNEEEKTEIKENPVKTDSEASETETENQIQTEFPVLKIEESDSAVSSKSQELIEERNYQIKFLDQKGDEINTQDYSYEISVTPKETYLTETIQKTESDSEVHEILLSLETQSAENETSSDGDSVSETRQYELNGETSSLTAFSADPEFSVRALRTPNPRFTVQTYGNIDQIVPFDETVDGSNRILAFNQTNGKTDTSTKYPLQSVGNDQYKLKTSKTLMKIYTTESYTYHEQPNIYYFNKLVDNASYTLKELWLLNPGEDENSTDRKDWTVYQDPINLTYTNNVETYYKNPQRTVLITDNTVLRLVYDPIETTFSPSARFFDYDITDGINYRSANQQGYATVSNGYGLGINSPGNYKDSDQSNNYAFGNANTGLPDDIKNVVLKEDGYSQRTVNQGEKIPGSVYGAEERNHNVYGMVQGINENNGDPVPIFSSSLDVPDLFSTSSVQPVAGKTVIDNGFLTFDRSGDKYTLAKASCDGNSEISDLNYFSHPGTNYNIWTNHFWPLDFGTYGIDAMTGFNVGSKRTNVEYGYLDSQGNFRTIADQHTFPVSDNNIAHNNLFGMKFQIEFELDGSYEGPLDYFFFGDDDMWVFIDDHLVADIGGVKQSKGVYVDLRKRLPELNNKTDQPVKHTMTVFYTERGLSGSTCYMEFTLPSVSGVSDPEKTGGFKLLKQTYDNDEEAEFTFDITLMDSNGDSLKNDYAYLKFKTGDGNPMEHPDEDWLIFQSHSRITLKKDEYILIRYLPVGSKFRIEEILPDGDKTEVRFEPPSGNTQARVFEGTITGTASVPEVICINNRFYKLPETGGFGINRFYTAGGLLMLLSFSAAYRIRKRGVDLK